MTDSCSILSLVWDLQGFWHRAHIGETQLGVSLVSARAVHGILKPCFFNLGSKTPTPGGWGMAMGTGLFIRELSAELAKFSTGKIPGLLLPWTVRTDGGLGPVLGLRGNSQTQGIPLTPWATSPVCGYKHCRSYIHFGCRHPME